MSDTTMEAPKRSIDPRWLPLVITTVGTFMSILDTNIINIALPTVLKDFNASLSSGQMVVAAYVMALAIVIPLSGFLGERLGMKRLYMFTLGCFVLGSALCGLAWNVESLVFFRALQGLGGGMIQPLGMALVFTMITPLERPKFIAVFGLPNLVAPLLGPSLGGYIVEYASWRWVFLINLPIGLLNIGGAYFLLKETVIKKELKLDVRGFASAAIAFPCLLLGFSEGSETGWSSPYVFVLMFIGTIALAAFIYVELRHHDPLLRIRLFADRNFRMSLFVQWVGIFSLFGLNFVIPLFLQRVHHMGAAETGLVLLPMGIVSFVVMNVAGGIYYKVGPRPLVMTGLLVLALTTAAWSRIDGSTPVWVLMLVVSGRGIGLGMFGQIVQVTAYNAVPPEYLSRATALVNVCQRLSTAFSTAVLTTVLIVGLQYAGAPSGTSIAAGDAPISNMLSAFRYAFGVMTILSLVGFVLAYFLRDHTWEEQRRKKQEGHEAQVVVENERMREAELAAGD